MARKRAPVDPVTAFARNVVAGKVVAGRLQRLACQRHLQDLEDGPARGLRWDPAAAQHIIDFFSHLHLAEGEHEGQPFLLQPWQQFAVGCVFGWKGEDGFRRFRTAYVEVAKGAGKTPMAAGVGLYGLVADGEAGSEVYSAATTHDQASILFRDAKNMVSASPALSKRLDVGQANIAYLATRSFFRPVSSEHKGLDGKRVHMALIDEVHEHPTSLVVDKMRAGTKGRRQALVWEITNAGHDRASVCWQHHQYSVDVLEGRVANDSWFAFVCGLDPCAAHLAEGKQQPVDGCPDCDDWRNEACWPKANPNLGVSVTLKYLREQVAEAQGMPAKEGIVRRLNFCWWTEGLISWLPADLWARGAGKIDFEQLRGRRCCGGLDVASKTDVAALVLCFPDYPDPGHHTLRCWFWIPRAGAQVRAHRDNVPWLVWEREGWVTLTEGEVIDLDRIELDIKEANRDHWIEDTAFDRWEASSITTHLQHDGLKVVEFAQTLANFTEPTKSFEALLKSGKLHHGDNPVLGWMAANVQLLSNAGGQVRPAKPEPWSPRKVDGIVAAVMAHARVLVREAESPYESGGVFVVGEDAPSVRTPAALPDRPAYDLWHDDPDEDD